ncbi:MAG: hemerythrin domain-containing protein [Rhodanobacter sp.]
MGRSRSYTCVDLPERLRHWHAPRANRWEHLCVMTGVLEVQWLAASGLETETLQGGARRWIAPGKRWRVSRIDHNACFQLEIHADDGSPAGAPQPVRSAWLDEVAQLQLDDVAALPKLLAELGPGQHSLVRGSFDFGPALCTAMANSGRTLFWHPLEAGNGRHVALVVRSRQPAGLLEYMGRDHAVIEAVLSGALRGNTEHGAWLRSALTRHLLIEEGVLFPAYLDAGGNSGWVRGLCNEHQHLRRHLDNLHEVSAQRRFLLLLDGHDEKEEQLVYPDILARLAEQADGLSRTVMQYPIGTHRQLP